MVDTGIFATTAEVSRKATSWASTTSNAEAYINDFMTQAESEINCATKYNWTDKYTALNVDVKGILKEASSNLAAIYVIAYDLNNFPSRVIAEDAINILRDSYLRCLAILRDEKVQEFAIGA